jgi:hypothetical protein
VFSLAERGSKLNEPTKIFAPSTAYVFACRPDVPPDAVRPPESSAEVDIERSS